MKIFITGGTGFIGQRLAEKLAEDSNEVVLLLRNPAKALKFNSGMISFVKGDILDEDAIDEGIKGADTVYHMAAYTKPWSEDPGMPNKINVMGTLNVLEAAVRNGVRIVVITSTAGTMSYSRDGKPVGETTNSDPQFHTEYEKTKAEAERLAAGYSGKIPCVVIVNPTRVYGPGELSKSNSPTRIMKLYRKGLWRVIPGSGDSVGNYVFVDDVVNGHILAAQKGVSGERYILGGENLSFNELFNALGETTGKTRRMLRVPLPVLEVVVKIAQFIADLAGRPPVITKEWLARYMNDWIMSSEKAINHLGYTFTPFREGAAITLNWLNTAKNKISR